MPARNKTTVTLIGATAAMLLSLLIAASGCNRGDQSPNNADAEAFVSVAPLGFFAERIAGRHVTLRVLIKPGANPHTYTPTPKQIVSLNRGRLLLCGGSGFGRIISSRLTSADSKLRIVNLADGLAIQQHHDHDHGHDHGNDDQHVWMSPRIAKSLAAGICRELCTLAPSHSSEFQDNLRKLQDELDSLDTELAKTLAPHKGKSFFVFHPAFGHFAETYGLKQEALEHQGKSPGPKHITQLLARAKAANAKVIFVQPQFSLRAADMIAREVGARVVVLDPLSSDYVNNLRHIAEELRKALEP
jgi:zinc transport system substrate-binding protein